MDSRKCHTVVICGEIDGFGRFKNTCSQDEQVAGIVYKNKVAEEIFRNNIEEMIERVRKLRGKYPCFYAVLGLEKQGPITTLSGGKEIPREVLERTLLLFVPHDVIITLAGKRILY